MSHCHALTSKGSRCKSYASVLESSDSVVTYDYTCSKHKEYFKKEKIPDTWKNNRWRFVRSLEKRPWLRHFIEDALRLGLVVPTEEEIASIPSRSSYTCFILLCAKYVDGFLLDWNSQLSAKVLRNLWIWVGSIGPMTITYSDIFSMIKNSVTTGFYNILITYTHNRISENPWFKFFERCSEEEWFDEVLHCEFHEKLIQDSITSLLKSKVYRENIPLLSILETGQLTDWLSAKKSQRYSVLKERIVPFKEELLAESWTPERFRKWCLDTEELHELQINWG